MSVLTHPELDPTTLRTHHRLPFPGPVRPGARARAGRLLPRPRERAAGHHRDPQHGPRPRARRHPLLPVPDRGRRPRRRPAPLPGHDLQERPRRAGPRRRQGRHHRRPRAGTSPRRCCAPTAGSSSRSAGGTSPPATSAPTWPTWTSSTARPATSSDAARSTAAPATPRCSPPSACSPRMRACAAHVWGSDSLRGRTVGVAGVGKVGHLLVGHLVDAGAHVVVTDVSTRAVERVRTEHPQVDVVAGTDALVRAALDVYAPCALGGALDRPTVEALSAKIVCGAANNQLADDGAGRAGRAAARARHHLRPGLPRQRRRRHPGRRRGGGLRDGAGPAPRRGALRHHRGGAGGGRRSRASARRGPRTTSPRSASRPSATGSRTCGADPASGRPRGGGRGAGERRELR